MSCVNAGKTQRGMHNVGCVSVLELQSPELGNIKSPLALQFSYLSSDLPDFSGTVLCESGLSSSSIDVPPLFFENIWPNGTGLSC